MRTARSITNVPQAALRKFLVSRGLAEAATLPLKLTSPTKRSFKYSFRARLGEGENEQYIRLNIANRDTSYESGVTIRALVKLRQAGFNELQIPIGYWKAYRAAVYYEAPGQVLTSFLTSTRALRDYTQQVCAWLMRLQRKHLLGPRRLPKGYDRLEIGWWQMNLRSRTIRQSFGTLSENVRALRSELIASVPFSFVHGDLHPNNVLVHQGSIIPIDFGNALHFDPLVDWGTFLSQLYTERMYGRIRGNVSAAETAMRLKLPQRPSFRRRLYVHAAWQTLKNASHMAATVPSRAKTYEHMRLVKMFLRHV